MVWSGSNTCSLNGSHSRRVWLSAPLWVTIMLPVLIGAGMIAGWIKQDSSVSAV